MGRRPPKYNGPPIFRATPNGYAHLVLQREQKKHEDQEAYDDLVALARAVGVLVE